MRGLPTRRSPLSFATALAAVLTLSAAVPAAPAVARSVSVGAFVPGADREPALIDGFGEQVGRSATLVVSYKDWGQTPFLADQLDGIWRRGAVPMVTWEPWGVSLRRIAAGGYDGYLRAAARSAAAWGRPLFVRFAQEMNGDWFPWGGRPRAYRGAWRRMVGIFRGAGADNVRWVWSPYTESTDGRRPFAPYFPGQKWVDWAGLDVVNWGGSFPWRRFDEVVGGSYHRLAQLTSRPVVLAEVGSGEEGGNKALWLSRMLRRDLPRMGRIRAVCFWSEQDSRGDLRVDSSARALAALRAGLARPLYGSSRAALLRTPPLLGR